MNNPKMYMKQQKTQISQGHLEGKKKKKAGGFQTSDNATNLH